MKISNNKLLHRAIGIVARCAKVSEKEARVAVLKSAHHTDTLSEAMLGLQDSEVIDVAFRVELVVPRAILIASGRYTAAQAAERLRAEPVVAKILR